MHTERMLVRAFVGHFYYLVVHTHTQLLLVYHAIHNLLKKNNIVKIVFIIRAKVALKKILVLFSWKRRKFHQRRTGKWAIKKKKKQRKNEAISTKKTVGEWRRVSCISLSLESLSTEPLEIIFQRLRLSHNSL